jgi:hypothetical protein
MEFGSRKRGARALQTSWMAPSSDHVAAMIGSMYCWKRGEGERQDGNNGGCRPLILEEQALVCRRF